jgi:O-antigen/teichoic acid export membrane protein
MTLASFLAFPFFFVGTLVVEEFVVIFLGEKWDLIIVPMQIVLLTIPLRIVVNLMWPLVRALGYSEVVMNHTAVSLAVVSMVVMFATPYGINWIAASWLFTTPVLFFIAIFMLRNKVAITAGMLLKLMLRPLSISMLSLILTLGVDSLLNFETSILHGVLKVFLFFACYISLSWILNRQQFDYAIRFRLS